MNNKDIMASMGFNEPDSSILQPTVHTSNGMANEFLSRLCDYITRFEQDLSDDEELALKIVSFGEAVTIIVEDIGYWNPSLISFYGVNTSNERVQLIQHVSQLSFLLVAVKAAEPTAPRRRIGFKLRNEMDERGKEMDEREA